MTSARVSGYADGGLLLEFSAPIATLTLNRPRQLNALNIAMWRDFPRAVADVATRDDIRILIIRGSDGNFASGADIAEFPDVFSTRQNAIDYTLAIGRATQAIAALDRPVIAGIEGYCIGAGLAVALACDLRICADTAKLGVPPAKLGLMYSLSDTRRLVQAVGSAMAKDMLFTADLVDTARALSIGLITEVHPVAHFETAVLAKAMKIAGLSAWTMRQTKAVSALVEQGVMDDTDETRGWFADVCDQAAFHAAISRFNRPR